jgi:TadE-like protein
MSRRDGERGQTSVELLLMLPLLLLIGLIIWQAHLTLSVANDAQNAARTASREGGDADAARRALEPEYRDNITKCKPGQTDCGIQVHGRRVDVWVDVPIIVPGGSGLGFGFHVHGKADMPEGL